MPPLPLVAFDVISARAGSAGLVAGADADADARADARALLDVRASCTAIGAPCSFCRSSFIASRPMPAALRRARVDLARRLVRALARAPRAPALPCRATCAASVRRGLASARACRPLLRFARLVASGGAGGGGGGGVALDQQLGHRRRQLAPPASVGLAHRQPRQGEARSRADDQHALRCAEARVVVGATTTRAGPASGTRRSQHAALIACPPLPHRERDVAEVGARAGDHHLAQQAIRDVLVAHDRDALAAASFSLRITSRRPGRRARP